jgi:ATP-dependent DNA helicase RecG
VLRDEDTIIAARAAAETLLEADPELAGHELLRAAVLELEESAQGEFIEKS